MKKFIGVIFIALTVVLTTTFTTRYPKNILSSSPAMDKNIPKWFANNVNIKITDVAGKTSHAISADAILKINNQKYTKLINPKANYYTSASHWHLYSDSGRIYQDLVTNYIEKIILSGQVKVINTAFNNQNTIIQTEKLYIYPNKEIVTTDKPISIRYGKHQITAHSMYSDLLANKTTLKGQIWSEYHVE